MVKHGKIGKRLKPNIAFEVRKDNCMRSEKAARVAIRIKAAINSSRCTASESMETEEPILIKLDSLDYRNNRGKKRLTDEEYTLVRKN